MKSRSIAFIFFLLVCFCAIGQTDLESKLHLIIKDSTNRFKSFKAGFRYQTIDDSVFSSTLNFEGTIDSKVLISTQESTYIMDSYEAIISTSIQRKQGIKIVDEWKSKISAILDQSFEITKIKSKNYPLDYVWQFERGLFLINVAYVSSKGNGESLLLLQISYMHLRNPNEN
jgi:hypothetical protein